MKQLNASTISAEAACGELLLDVVPLLMATIRLEARPLQPSDLSVPQFRALAFIDRHAGMSLSAVAEMLGLTLSSVSKLMEGMVEAGYVRQETCPRDRRRAQLFSAPKGQATMEQARGQMAERLAEHLGGLSPTALRQVETGLRHLQVLFAPPAQ